MLIDQLTSRIDAAFGTELPFSDRALTGDDIAALERVFGDAGYQHYLQDQVNRQIIRDYLVNAVRLNYIPEDALPRITRQASTAEGRAALSLYMLVMSVEQAAELLAGDAPPLRELRPEPGSTPHLNLIKG